VSEVQVHMQLSPNNYEGDFPSVTIHFREQDRCKAERLKNEILKLIEEKAKGEE